jgi:hypothetical protein
MTNKGPSMNAHFNVPRRGASTLAFMVTSGASLMVSIPASAEISPALDRISISVGAFIANPEFNSSINTPYGILQSGNISLGEKVMPRLKGEIILFDSQGLSFDIYQYKHDYGGATDHTANVLGNAVSTATNANFGLKLDYAKLAYKWWLGSGNTVVGGGAGAAYYKISMLANASLSINNASAGIGGEYSDDTVAPLVEIGLRHAISPDLRLFADVSGVWKSDGPLKGEIYIAAIGVEWFPVKNVGLALGYGVSQIDLKRDEPVIENLKVKYYGPSALVKFRF